MGEHLGQAEVVSTGAVDHRVQEYHPQDTKDLPQDEWKPHLVPFYVYVPLSQWEPLTLPTYAYVPLSEWEPLTMPF